MSSPLLARYADAVFWLARYVERAEDLARILEVNETHARDRSGAQDWLWIVEINADEARFSQEHGQVTAESVTRFYLTDAENPTSIRSAIVQARENARTLRPLISTEMWVQLNVFHNRLRSIAAHELVPGNLCRLLAEIKAACQTFTGIAEGTFYRDQAWCFYRLGQYIERADQTTRLLDTKYQRLTRREGASEIGQWYALLRSASGYHAFRRVHSSDLTSRRVVGFLLFNTSFPRSVSLCVGEAHKTLGALKSCYGMRAGDDAAERLEALRAILATRSTDEILGAGLHEFVDFLQRCLIDVTKSLSAAFFNPVRAPAGDGPAAAALAGAAQ